MWCSRGVEPKSPARKLTLEPGASNGDGRRDSEEDKGSDSAQAMRDGDTSCTDDGEEHQRQPAGTGVKSPHAKTTGGKWSGRLRGRKPAEDV